MERKKTQLEIFQSVGCLAKVQIPMPKRVKIGPKTVDCVFIGYAKSSKACRFLVRKSEHPDINENTIIESDNAEFFEHIYPYKTRHEQSSGGLNDLEMNQVRMYIMMKIQYVVHAKERQLHLD